MEINRIEEYIKKVRWKKTNYIAAHEYTVKAWNHELEDEFCEFVHAIQTTGVKGTFKGSRYVYLTIGKYTYWTMGFSPKGTILINRKVAEKPQ